MSCSRLMAERFAIDLSGFALGIWEAARLLGKRETKADGAHKVAQLRERLTSFRQHPALVDSLRLYFNEEFNPEDYASLLDRLERGETTDVIRQIRELVDEAKGYLHEARRANAGFKRTL